MNSHFGQSIGQSFHLLPHLDIPLHLSVLYLKLYKAMDSDCGGPPCFSDIKFIVNACFLTNSCLTQAEPIGRRGKAHEEDEPESKEQAGSRNRGPPRRGGAMPSRDLCPVPKQPQAKTEAAKGSKAAVKNPVPKRKSLRNAVPATSGYEAEGEGVEGGKDMGTCIARNSRKTTQVGSHSAAAESRNEMCKVQSSVSPLMLVFGILLLLLLSHALLSVPDTVMLLSRNGLLCTWEKKSEQMSVPCVHFYSH